MTKEFDGKIALVTGGGSGIGRATALAFGRDGAKVVIGNRNTQRGEETVGMIKKAGGEASFKKTDVTIAKEIAALVDHAVKTYGGLDFAFNNAGIEGEIASTVDQTEENYDAVFDVNVKGVWLSMKYEIPRMLERGGGAIVNCSSVAGLVGFPNMAPYFASKHAVIGLTKVAALECSAQGIRVNAVNPAVIDTEMVDRIVAGFGNNKENDLVPLHPIGRLGRVDEIAEAVVWLCSNKSSFVTGHSLVVDGGFTAK